MSGPARREGLPPELSERLPPEVRARLPGGAEFRPELEFKKDRVGFSVRREVEHLTRCLSLDERQRRLTRLQLDRVNALLKRHVVERRRHRERTLALHRRIQGLRRAFDGALRRMAREESEGRRAVRRVLRPDQRKVYDMLLAERRRIERKWIELREKEVQGKPPPRGSV